MDSNPALTSNTTLPLVFSSDVTKDNRRLYDKSKSSNLQFSHHRLPFITENDMKPAAASAGYKPVFKLDK